MAHAETVTGLIMRINPRVDPYEDPSAVFVQDFTLQGCGAPPAALAGIPKGMLTAKERTAFFLLARDYCQGRGCIVDAGSFCGSSTALFGYGLSANPKIGFLRAQLDVFDLFSCTEDYLIECIHSYYGLKLARGAEFQSIHRTLTAPLLSMQRVYPGDFLQTIWQPRPIELLFIDLAKTPALLGEAMRRFMPQAEYGHTLLIHQDYYWYQQGYIPLVMEYLSDYFEPYCPRIDNTAIFRCTRSIPETVMAKVHNFAFDHAERQDLLRRCADKLAPDDAKYIHLSAAVLQAYTERAAGDAAAKPRLQAMVRQSVNEHPRGRSDHWDFVLHTLNAEWQLGLGY